MARRKIDWDRIEAEYRVGQLTVRELGEKHGVAFESISRHMKKRGIERDLTDQVRAATKAAVIANEVNKASTERQQKVVDAVSVAAKVNSDLIERHKGAIGALRGLAETMAAELVQSSEALQSGVKDDDIVAAAGALGLSADQVRSLVANVALPARAMVADKLAGVITKLVPLERKTYGIDEGDGDTKSASWIDLLEQSNALLGKEG